MTNPNTYRVIAKSQNPSKQYRKIGTYTWLLVELTGTVIEACKIAARHSKRNPTIEYRVMTDVHKTAKYLAPGAMMSYQRTTIKHDRIVRFLNGREMAR